MCIRDSFKVSGNAVPARAAGGILLIVPLRGLFQGLELLHVMAEKQFRVMLRGIGLTEKELEILGVAHAGE